MEEVQQNSSFVPYNIRGSKNVYEWVESQDFNIRSPNIVDNYTSPDLPSENEIEDVHKFSLQSGSNPSFVTEGVNDFPLCNESNPQLVSKSRTKNVTEDVYDFPLSNGSNAQLVSKSSINNVTEDDREFPICNKSNLRLVLNNNFGNDPKYCSTEQGKIYTDMCKMTCSSIISESNEEIFDNSPEKLSSEIPYQENIQFYKDRSYLSPSPKMRKISSTKKIHVISNISLSSLENISPEKTEFTKEHFEVPKSVSRTIKCIYELNSESSNKIETVSSAEDSVLNKNNISDAETKRFDIIESDSSSSSDNNEEDKDFYLIDSSTKSDSDKESNGSDIKDLLKPQSQKIRESKNRQLKLIRCKFCQDDVNTKNFTRHMERKHAAEEEVKKILSYPKNSRERRQAFILFRNNTNFDLFISGIMRPNRQLIEKDPNTVYYPCAYCKGIYMRGYLKRHAKFCPIKTANKNRKNHISASQTFTACAMDITNVVSKLNVKQQVFDLMKGDDIAFEAKKDPLIAHYGESYLKKHKRERMAYACSSRMRELARLLISYRKIINNRKVSFKDLLIPSQFSLVVSAVRDIAGYDPTKKSFRVPSLAMHLGTSLKHACHELIHLVLEESPGFKCTSADTSKKILSDAKNFIKLIESRWTIELASLANKDLAEKQWKKPLLLPLVSDIKIFREESLKLAEVCINQLSQNNGDINTYKLLSQCTLALLILFNRRRIGDVQYLKVNDYNFDRKTDFTDFQNALTESEKQLTLEYKRIVNTGKGSRAVVILVPKILQKYIDILLSHRAEYISCDNEYLFALPGSTIKWGKGDVAFKTLTTKMNLRHPESIGSNKLRKHIATVMQILNLSKTEIKQFSTFMGHTEKTHDEFYELPVDIYQTAKVSKVLLMMEKGAVPVEHKGKSLAEINIDVENVYPEEDEKEDGVDSLNNSEIGPSKQGVSNSTPSVSACEYKEETTTAFESDEFDYEDEFKNKNRKPIQKKSWTDEDIEILNSEFENHIKEKKYPSGKEIEEFKQKNKISRPVAVIKAKIQHIIKKKK